MISVSVTLPPMNFDQIGKAAAFRGLTITVDGVVTDIGDSRHGVPSKFNVAKAQLTKRIRKMKPRNYDNLQGMVSIQAKDEQRSALPLVLFGASSRGSSGDVNYKTTVSKSGIGKSQLMKNAGKSGVSFKVLMQGGKGFRSDAQIIPGGGGSLQVVRFLKGVKGRGRIKELRTLSITSMIAGKSGLLERIKQRAQERLTKNTETALAYFIANPEQAARSRR